MNNSHPNHELPIILVIDDLPENLNLLADLLKLKGYDVRVARSGKLALRSLEYFYPDLILLDIKMPELDGYQVCKLLKDNPKTREIPVIFLSALDTTFDKVRAFEVGGIDYITKPIQEEEVMIRISTQLELLKQKRQLQREIEERKKAEEIAKEALQVKSRFLANMSHEIRTPMNAILGIAELLAHTELNLQQQDFVNILQSSSHNLLLLINDILDFSKLEAQEVHLDNHPFNLDELIEEILDLFSIQASLKGIELCYFKTAEVPAQLIGDSLRLRQVITNFVSNALKFTHEGEIVIRITLHSRQPFQLKFMVEDTGIGIKEDSIKQIFKPFSQAEKSTTRIYGGTGLGLSICQQLVNLMTGEIGVDSSLHQGSRFWFTATFPTPELTENTDLQILANQAILLLDNHQSRSQMLHQYLQQWQINTYDLSEENLPQNISLALINKEIIENQNMIQLLFAKLPDSKFIILTNSADYKIPDFFPSEKIFAYLNTPIKLSILSQCLREFYLGSPFFIHHSLASSYQPKTADAKILVVEDTLVNQKVILNLLKLLGYTADCVSNGQEALDRLASDHYDLIFMDCQMPILDGYQTTQKIRKIETNHNIIIGLTAFSLKGDREKCLAAGMDDYLSKPVNLKQLSQTLNKWLKIPNYEDTSFKKDPIKFSAKSSHQAISVLPLDLERIREFTGGDQSFAQEIINCFLMDTPETLTAIQQSLEAQDFQKVEYFSHKLKGSAANIGIKYMPEISARLEKLAREDLATSQELLNELHQVFNQLQTSLIDFKF